MEHVRVEIASLSLVPSGGGTCAIVLREVDGERFLPVVIGLLEAQSIAVKVQGMPTPRPLTHDLLNAVLTALHGRLVRVTIDNVREGTFYASLEIDDNGNLLKLDSRPSDAIAIAVRAGAPIYVSEAVMDAAGATPENIPQMPTTPPPGGPPSRTPPPFPGAIPADAPVHALNRVEELEVEMQDAIRNENYERAAEIRDEIQRLRNEQLG